MVLAACSQDEVLPSAPVVAEAVSAPVYQIGPGDTLRIFVWGNPGLSDTVPVRPDGRISIPLLEDLEVAGKSPTDLGREIESKLSAFVQDPLVTVIVTEFVGPFSQQVRVVGEAVEPPISRPATGPRSSDRRTTSSANSRFAWTTWSRTATSPPTWRCSRATC
jgi:polysaccharide export outer membrane protein